jgi:hypothetical protein
MPLDDRLREMYERTANQGRDELDAPRLDLVVARTRRVRTRRRVSGAAGVMASLVAAALLVAPHVTATPSRQPVAPPSHGFRSAANRYSAQPPDGWSVAAATHQWLALGSDPETAGASDVFRSATGEEIRVESQALPAGMAWQTWYARYLPKPAQREDCYGPASGMVPETVDGLQAHLFGRDLWCGFTEVLVVKGGRVYDIVATFTSYRSDVFPQPTLDGFLASMRLSP